MSTDRDTTRIVRSWLEEGVTALPDRVLDTVLDQVPATPQRRLRSPARRSTSMPNSFRLAVVAAAALVVVIVGFSLLPRTGGVGGQPTPLPTPTEAPSAQAGPPEMPAGAVGAGTYTVSGLSTTPFVVTVPEGWSRDKGGFISKGDWQGIGVALSTWKITHIYGDSCHWTGTLQPVGTPAELAGALARQAGHEIVGEAPVGPTQATIGPTGPTDVLLGGIPATRIEMLVPPDFDATTCDDRFMRLWPDPGPDESGGLPTHTGEVTTVWALEDQGTLTAVITLSNWDSIRSDVAELKGVLQSFHFKS